MEKDIGSILKEKRIEAGVSVKEISDRLTQEGFKASEKTIYSWESGNSQPTPGALLSMCNIYGIEDILSVFGYDNHDENGFIKPTYKDFELLEKYHSLDTYGQATIDLLLDRELERYQQIKSQISLFPAQAKAPPEDYGDNVFFLETFTQTASAGTGQYLDDDATQRLGYPADRVPDGTDFAVPVSGDSMEPMLYDGDIIFVQRTSNLSYGDIGLFTANGEGFVKEYGETGLVSLNEKYPVKTRGEADDFRIVGKVLGKL